MAVTLVVVPLISTTLSHISTKGARSNAVKFDSDMRVIRSAFQFEKAITKGSWNTSNHNLSNFTSQVTVFVFVNEGKL